jgi:hypothetical protein
MAELSRLKRVIDVFVKKDTTMINDENARPGCNGSQLGWGISPLSEDRGESIVRARDMANPVDFEAHPSAVLDVQVGHDLIDSETSQDHVFLSSKPPLSENTPKDEKRSLMSRVKGRSQDSADAIDRLFNGLI